MLPLTSPVYTRISQATDGANNLPCFMLPLPARAATAAALSNITPREEQMQPDVIRQVQGQRVGIRASSQVARDEGPLHG